MVGHELRGGHSDICGPDRYRKEHSQRSGDVERAAERIHQEGWGRQAARPNRGDRRENYKRAVMPAVMKVEWQLCQAVTTILKRGNRQVSHI